MVDVRPADATAPQMFRSRPLQPIDPNKPPVERVHLNQPLHAGRAVRQDRFRAGFVGDRLVQPPRDVLERLVPGDAHEARLAFRTHALQRMKHAIGVIHALEIVIHLRAEGAARERVLRIAAELRGIAVADFDDPAARIRTVMAARATHHPQRRGGRGHGFLGHRSQDFRRRQGPSPDWHSHSPAGPVSDSGARLGQQWALTTQYGQIILSATD